LNLKQGLFRLWVVVAVLWVYAWIYYVWTDCFYPVRGVGNLVYFSTGHYGVPLQFPVMQFIFGIPFAWAHLLPDQQPDALVIVQLAFLSLKGKPRRIRTITAGVPALCTPLVACRAALACSAYLLRHVLRCFFARGQSPLQRKAVQHVTKHGIVTLFSGAGVCSGVLFVTLSEGRHGGIHLSPVKPRHDSARFSARKM
jgi:hypothetical protein